MRSGFFEVLLDDGSSISCQARGKIKKTELGITPLAIGDRVKLAPLPDGNGIIEEIYPRGRVFSRKEPGPNGLFEQVILANPDLLVIVFACQEPSPHLRMLDRFLVIAEKQEIPLVIVVNKTDLVSLEDARTMFQVYPQIGYRVIFTSSRTGAGVDELKYLLAGKLAAFTGPSGVGKTSLLNCLQPGLGLAAKEVSRVKSKGKHTTIVRKIFALENGGFVADLPGIRSLLLWDIQPEEVDGYFPDIRPYVSGCQFSDCTHRNEPGCAVIEAVKTGAIHPSRFQSYLNIRFGLEEDQSIK